MATSGVQSFTLTVEELISMSMLDIGAIAIGESPTADEEIDAIRRLNLLMSGLQNTNIFLYKRVDTTLDTVASVATYSTDSGTRRLLDAYITVDNVDTALNILDVEGYRRITWKDTPGIPSEILMDYNTSTPNLTVYPVPEQVYTISYRIYKIFDSVINSSETLDINQAGLPMLQKGLSYYLANSYRLPLEERTLLLQEYKAARMLYTSQDTERSGTEVITPKSVLIT